MKTLYIECKMGAAGDMLTAALLELIPDPDAFVKKLNGIGIPGVEFKAERAVKCGITGTHMNVFVNGEEEGEHGHHHHHDHEAEEHHHHHHDSDDHHDHHHDGEEHHDHHHDGEHHHHHSGLHDIEHIVKDHLDIPDKVKKDVLDVFGMIAEAESHVHNMPITDIHFHEVGTMDAVADITAVCMLINEIAPDEIVVSPVHVGSGTVKCAHGILPVPAPATAYILQGVPSYGGSVDGELCTPTGAALLKHFAARFGDMPMMSVSGIGYGMGRKDFERANCVRVMIGETEDKSEEVLELSCNIDDMTAEEIGFACERFFEGGAFEVYTVPIGMKKTRPGTLIRVMVDEGHKDEMVRLIYKYTSTIGVRETRTKRYVMDRHIETVDTPYGEVRRKVSAGYGSKRIKYEYEDVAKIAKEQNISYDEALELIMAKAPQD